MILFRKAFLVCFVCSIGFLFGSSAAEARIDQGTVRMIAFYEGFSPTCVNDPAGHASIGYGHLIHLGPCTKKDRKRWGRITRAQADSLLRQELKYFRQEIKRRVHVGLKPRIWTALLSFTYNLGPGYLDFVDGAKTPPTHVAKQLNKKNFKRAARQMRIYNGAYIGKKRVVLEGLKRRRNHEYRLIIQAIS
jgi:GH24 family phage-related lysozyme (muramidase)